MDILQSYFTILGMFIPIILFATVVNLAVDDSSLARVSRNGKIVGVVFCINLAVDIDIMIRPTSGMDPTPLIAVLGMVASIVLLVFAIIAVNSVTAKVRRNQTPTNQV